MPMIEYQSNQLAHHEIEVVRKHLRSGIIPERLKPNGTISTSDGAEYFSQLLLGCNPDRFSISLGGPAGNEFLELSAKSAAFRQNYPPRVYPHKLRRIALHEDDLRVGLFGYLLNPYQEMSDALRFEMEQQPQAEGFLSQFIEVKVNFNNFGKNVDLLVLYPTFHQSKVPDEEQFVVISHDYRILPSASVFVPVPAHILPKFS